MSGALAKYLKDFSEFVPPETPQTFDLDPSPAAFEPEWPADPVISVDLDTEKRNAFAEGEEAGKQQAEKTHQAEVEALRTQHEQEKEELRVRYEEEIATHLATSVISMKQMVSSHIETVCVRLFATLMEREFAEKAAVDLAQQIIREIEGGFAGTIKITGPEPMIAKIRDTLGPVENPIDYEIATDIDVQVQMDNSVIMTRLADFFQSVKD